MPEDRHGQSAHGERAWRTDDADALDRLVRLGGDTLVSELVATYVEDMPLRLARAREALRARDADGLYRAAHAMRSSSAQLGGRALADACEAMEDAAERGDLAATGMALADVEAHYTTFSDRLAARVASAAMSGSPSITSGRRSDSDNRRVIAVVDDNADNRLLVEALIGDRFELHEYATGGDALDGMEARPPALVLLDVSLPGMDGVEVLRRIRESATLRGVPVVALTAHAMAGDRERYLAVGFDDYVAKPIVDDAALVWPVERLLGDDASSDRSR